MISMKPLSSLPSLLAWMVVVGIGGSASSLAQAAQSAVYINVGGSNYTDGDGNVWVAESLYDYDNGEGRIFSTSDTITETNKQSLYQKHRWDHEDGNELEYAIPLESGDYIVSLHFADTYAVSDNERVFHVEMESVRVIEDLDVHAKVGHDAARVESELVSVTDGELNLKFIHKIENPFISAIEILPMATLAPVTASPVTAAPVTPVPVTIAPTTLAPVTAAPISTATPTTAPPSFPSIYINAGGGNYTDGDQNLWVADTVYNYHSSNGVTHSTSATIKGTSMQPLYNTERWDWPTGEELEYSIPVPNGLYNVTLHFAEIYARRSGERVFDVEVENAKVIADLDIYALAGGDTALTRTMNVAVSDAELNIVLIHNVENPKISAIEVHQLSSAATTAPVTAAPTTTSPTSVAPVTSAPTTSAPTTQAPVTPAPVTIAPTTLPPVTTAPATAAPVTSTPVTPAPMTPSPVTAAPVVAPTSQPTSAGPQITSFVLINSDTDTPIQVLNGGEELILSEFSSAISIEALTVGTIGSVVFLINDEEVRTESVAPYALAGDSGGDFAPWSPAIWGPQKLTAVIYDQSSGNGNAGNSLSIDLTVWEFPQPTPTPPPAPTPYPTMTPSPPPTPSPLTFAPTTEAPIATAPPIPTPSPTSPIAFTPYYINVGGSEFTDSNGTSWAADSYVFYTNGGGGTYSTTTPIWNVQDQDEILFQTERWGEMKYELEVPNTDLEVTLYFAEIYSETQSPGARVFDVSIEGEIVCDNLDIYSEVEGYAALTKVVSVEVLDGSLTIDFAAGTQNPKLAGIEVNLVGHRAHAVLGGPYVQVDTDDNLIETVRVDGTGSHTHTPNSNLYFWTWILNGDIVASGEIADITFPVGESTLLLTVGDTKGYVATGSTTVTVEPFGYPELTSLSPSSGEIQGGTVLTILGSGFSATEDDTIVRFGSTELTGVALIEVVNFNKIRVLSVPQGIIPGEVDVSVETPAGQSNSLKYRYINGDLPDIIFSFDIVTQVIYGPSTLAFGPDGKLYVGNVIGEVYKIELDDDFKYVSHVKSREIANLRPPNEPRSILGLTFNPAENITESNPNPTVYVAHSLLYHSNYNEPGDEQVYSYNGKVSALSGPDLNVMEDVVTGLPVSDHDHGINGLEFGDNGELYIQIGGNTNAGVPGSLSTTGLQDEDKFSAATVVAHLTRDDFDGFLEYDNSTREQISGSGVEVFASGQRNSYDLVLHSNGYLYGTDNGPNYSYGARSTGCDSQGPDPEHKDKLNLLVEEGYYGHANRFRGLAGDARQCVWRDLNEASDAEYTGPLAAVDVSTNGITEFQTEHFAGQLRGHLLMGQWTGKIFDATLSSDGTSVLGDVQTLLFGGGLDLTQGPDGTLFVAQLGNTQVVSYSPFEVDDTTLKVLSVFPRRGIESGGSLLSIYGQNFDAGAVTVTVGGVDCPVKAVSPKKLTCRLLGGTGTVDIEVTAGPKGNVLSKGYRYIPGSGS